MRTDEKPWQWYVERADHFLAIEQDDVSLFQPTAPPWEFVSDYEKGGTVRLGTSVSGSFIARHPSGLRFRWYFDFEARDANGTGTLKPNVAEIARVTALLPPYVKRKMREHLFEIANAVRAEGNRAIDFGQKSLGEAGTLERLANGAA